MSLKRSELYEVMAIDSSGVNTLIVEFVDDEINGISYSSNEKSGSVAPTKTSACAMLRAMQYSYSIVKKDMDSKAEFIGDVDLALRLGLEP